MDIEDSESFRRTAEWFGLKNELQWKRLLAFDENKEGKKMTNKKDEHTQAKVFVHKNEKKKKMKRKRGEPEDIYKFQLRFQSILPSAPSAHLK